MAIIEELGLEVKVQVDGSAAAEYTDEEPDDHEEAGSQTTKVSHRYVESVDDAEFVIHAGLTPGANTGQEWIGRSPAHGLAFVVSFDGSHDVAGVLVRQQCISEVLDGVHDHANQTLRKFRFAPVFAVEDTDKERIAADEKLAKNLGLIRVCVYRATFKKEGHKKFSHGDLKIGIDGISLAEKALKGKALSHGTALSVPVQPTKNSTRLVDLVDSHASPLAVFNFKYRSKEALQQELIIPRPRSHSMEHKLEGRSLEEIRRLALERLSQMKDGAVLVKDEDEVEIAMPDRPFKYVKIEGGKKAIDLTEDD